MASSGGGTVGSMKGIFSLGAGIILSLGLALAVGAQDEVRDRLAAGEIIVSSQEVSDTCLKRGEVMGVIDASPEIVWQVIIEVDNYKYFMPRTLNSVVVEAEKLPLILQRRPERAEEVEALLGHSSANPAGCRIPGGKYTGYLYSHLNFPWPCSNRWYIIKLVQDESRALQHYYHSTWSLVTGNLRENSGEWRLEPFGPSKTKVVYRLLTDPGGSIPGCMVDRGTLDIMPQIIMAVRKRADKLNGRR